LPPSVEPATHYGVVGSWTRFDDPIKLNKDYLSQMNRTKVTLNTQNSSQYKAGLYNTHYNENNVSVTCLFLTSFFFPCQDSIVNLAEPPIK
jgi:hypothetical protein